MTGARLQIRDATAADALRCAEIYAPYVTGSAVSFEAQPPGAEEMAARIAAAQAAHAWLVAEDAGAVVGYAYAGTWMTRAAYRWSCTVSVYLEPGRRRTGAGRALYGALFARLADRGYRTALAGVTLPNPASEGLHGALGFAPVGVFRAVGFKDGDWRDVAWFQRPLTGDDGPPAPLR
ncbi:GNAT family N-acetyltransferase [Trujillonella endophytica]|uniref:Phosphinothricin acetyltransferase n=1 Tax=Trujillonella endophytica TaxID=673521 RepID=A0A1H8PTY3_9ACTN|nr:GNAT family N-acetyltransferase [Trujillella endophytica]SEO45420.1 phosphinothricin acetyltransferase [Trujillella endophytica]